MSDYENEIFRKAAQSAKIAGTDWNGTAAIKAFSKYYHEQYKRYERESHGYDGILEIAKDWWADNRSKYS